MKVIYEGREISILKDKECIILIVDGQKVYQEPDEINFSDIAYMEMLRDAAMESLSAPVIRLAQRSIDKMYNIAKQRSIFFLTDE